MVLKIVYLIFFLIEKSFNYENNIYFNTGFWNAGKFMFPDFRKKRIVKNSQMTALHENK